jgi:energy-coupling factor transporter transmembrane protein EcfT
MGQTAVFALGFLPFMLILGGFAIMGAIMFLVKLTANDMTEILLAMGTIWLVTIVVLIFVSNVCMSISPVQERFHVSHGNRNYTSNEIQERFTALQPVDIQAFNTAEEAVCEMIASTISYIRNDAGPQGPDAITSAIQQSIANAGGPVSQCPTIAVTDATSEQELDERLTRMENSLTGLVEPEAKKTFAATQCTEGFVDQGSRLAAIQQTIKSLQTQYLDPIQQKQRDLQCGRLSDCERKKGAAMGFQQGK